LKKENIDKQIEDIIDIEDSTLAIEHIESIAHDDMVKAKFENFYKGRLYSTIIRSLTHENFSEEEAKSLWDQIIDHMREMNHFLGRKVGVVVASLDYLANIKNILSEPKIIEENKSIFVADATTKDELTGLYLREVFDVVLKKEVEEANRNDSSLCLLMIDIDDFKEVNDTYGHQVGDNVLKILGATLNDSVREMDTAVRYGGEELAVVMPRVSLEKAYTAAQRIRKAIEKIQFKNFSVTISIGVSQTNKLVTTPEQLIKAADTALYQAKSRGKNQVVLSDNTD